MFKDLFAAGLRSLSFTKALAAVTLLGLLMPLSACSTNPTTGRSQFNALSPEQEVALGTEGKPEMVKEYGGEVAKAELRDYVREVGLKLVVTTAQDDPNIVQLPWEFTLLNSNVINAFALPGGKVFVSRGLAQKMTNEAQLAAVIGHEIGHVTARHINDRYTRMMGAQLGLGVVGVFLGGEAGAADLSQLGGQIAQVALMSYDRKQELESDSLGMRYMTRAGYDPIGARQVMELLAREAGAGGQPEFLSTHPHPESRIKQIDQLLAGPYAGMTGTSQFKTGEQEFRTRFLGKLAAAFGDEENERDRELAMQHACCLVAAKR
ncbi:MAG: M48 family metallopeptidase [Phycisphaerales bacterium]